MSDDEEAHLLHLPEAPSWGDSSSNFEITNSDDSDELDELIPIN